MVTGSARSEDIVDGAFFKSTLSTATPLPLFLTGPMIRIFRILARPWLSDRCDCMPAKSGLTLTCSNRHTGAESVCIIIIIIINEFHRDASLKQNFRAAAMVVAFLSLIKWERIVWSHDKYRGGGLTELGMYTVPKIKYKLKSLCHIFYKTRPDKSWFKFSKYCKCFKHHLNSVSKLNLKAIFVKILISPPFPYICDSAL